MDLETLSSDGKASLLTLPRSDLGSTTTSTDASSSLMLLQLPTGWSVNDLRDCHFVANKQQQAALVCNSNKHASFSLSHVETSNCLVLVPPPLDNSSNDDDDNNPCHNKKSKLLRSDSSLHSVLPARLLNSGASSSFLELQPKPLRQADLRRILSSRASWDPYNDESSSSIPTCTLQELADTLQQSTRAIQKCLPKFSEACRLHHDNRYCWLSEQALLVVHQAILSTLAEDAEDYAVAGVQDVNRLVQRTVERMSDEERFAQVEGVIRHCLWQLSNNNNNNDGMNNNADQVVKLSVTKVRCAQSLDPPSHIPCKRSALAIGFIIAHPYPCTHTFRWHAASLVASLPFRPSHGPRVSC